MPGNEYRDDHGHFTTEQNDGGPCPHEDGNSKRQIKSYYLVHDDGSKSGISRSEYEIYKKEGKHVIEEKTRSKKWYESEFKDIIISKEKEEIILNYIKDMKLDDEYRKYNLNSLLYNVKVKVNNIFKYGFYNSETSAITDSFYDEVKEKYDEWFNKQVKEGQETLNKFNKIKGEHTYEQDLKAVNSDNYKKSIGTKDFKKFHNNCQSCVQAYVLRRMGYDVEAKGFEDENKLTKAGWSYAMFVQPNFSFKNYNTIEHLYHGEMLQSLGNRVKTQHKNIKSIVEKDKDGSIYFCFVQWARSKSSHIFIVEKQNGQVRFVDPQNGSDNAEHYFEKDITGWYIVDPNYTSLTKIDNFNVSKYVDLVVKNK